MSVRVLQTRAGSCRTLGSVIVFKDCVPFAAASIACTALPTLLTCCLNSSSVGETAGHGVSHFSHEIPLEYSLSLHWSHWQKKVSVEPAAWQGGQHACGGLVSHRTPVPSRMLAM